MAITGVGTNQTFNYTGGVQTFTAPFSGTYKLEVYGAQGGSTQQAGGLGGYSYGTVELTQGTTLYIVVGGKGSKKTGNGSVAGGYNGGGSGGGYTSTDVSASGGGATHIALVTGQLKDIGYTKFVTNKKGLIVAGGGGGAGCNNAEHAWTGGSGGGTTGGQPTDSLNGTLDGYAKAKGGSQTSGGAGSTGGHPGGAGSFGQGGNLASYYASGGGGGLYGGGSGGSYNGIEGGAGGSGYIGGVTGGATSNGKRTGNGQAIITLTKISTLFYYNDVAIDKLIFDGTTITSLTYDGTKIF